MVCMCAQTRPRCILSSDSFGGTESEPMLTPREKYPLPEAQRRVRPATLHHTRQHAPHYRCTLQTELLQPSYLKLYKEKYLEKPNEDVLKQMIKSMVSSENNDFFLLFKHFWTSLAEVINPAMCTQHFKLVYNCVLSVRDKYLHFTMLFSSDCPSQSAFTQSSRGG